jgi:hypothetical protein
LSELVARSRTVAPAPTPSICKRFIPSITVHEIALIIYSIRATFSLIGGLCAVRPEKGETMALWKFIKYDDLSEAEKKALRKVLQEEKTAIQKGFAELKKTKKKSKKTKKAKKR